MFLLTYGTDRKYSEKRLKVNIDMDTEKIWYKFKILLKIFF